MLVGVGVGDFHQKEEESVLIEAHFPDCQAVGLPFSQWQFLGSDPVRRTEGCCRAWSAVPEVGAGTFSFWRRGS